MARAAGSRAEAIQPEFQAVFGGFPPLVRPL
jgi:hypothetical protein